MMVGKRSGRPGHPMRRTTSMTEFAPPDVLVDVAEEEDELQLPVHAEAAEAEDSYGWAIGCAAAAGRADWLAAYRARASPALAGLRRNSADLSATETAAFLRACGLCNRRLGPGRDTFMYRGDTAFCSLECRQQHITIEEWKDKCAALAVVAPPVAPAAVAEPVLDPAGAGLDKSGASAAAVAAGRGGTLTTA